MTGDGTLCVRRPGLLTTVQDLGRWGHQVDGVPVAGPMDTYSHRLANILVGNEASAATLEVTLIGPDIEIDAATTAAVAGAAFDVEYDGAAVGTDVSFAVRPGSHVRFGRRHAGARAYLAVAGGILTAPVLGSRATHLPSRMGGMAGRPLAADDILPLDRWPTTRAGRRATGMRLPGRGGTRVRVLQAPQASWFTDAAWSAFTSASFQVLPQSNRMGYRLEGPPLTRARDEEPLSEPIAFGSIQVPAAGQPILLMADRPTAGGYPKIATVIAADLPLAGQLVPGDAITFELCTRQQAAAALIARERELLRQAARFAS
ncbi:MAG: biotin-dependent carboxyltransferase family protein [Acidobacteria bacterium]|nr:biotin-dependent carboxyltransferase family protein [Acidobacteriota bacterium]